MLCSCSARRVAGAVATDIGLDSIDACEFACTGAFGVSGAWSVALVLAPA